jgi:acetyl esterase/lipase
MVCCSYRGYWTSKGRPSEKGIALDAAAALEWIKAEHKRQSASEIEPPHVVIWGQSIGAGVATNLAAQQDQSSADLLLKALILETPFVSVRAMLETLYPQKWLPYRYLWPFLWNHLDSWKALGLLGEKISVTGARAPRVLIVEAGRDELVPDSQGYMLERRCLDVGLAVERKAVSTALHNEVLVRPGGRTAVVEAIRNAARETHPK